MSADEVKQRVNQMFRAMLLTSLATEVRCARNERERRYARQKLQFFKSHSELTKLL